MNAPWIKTISDDHLSRMAPARRKQVLLELVWLLHGDKVLSPVTAGDVTFDPTLDGPKVFENMLLAYTAAKAGAIDGIQWVHDDAGQHIQPLTAAQLIAIYEAGASRMQRAYAAIGEVILPGIANDTITTRAQIEAALSA